MTNSMSDKLRCSILNCASHVDSKNVVYFRFPLENEELLKRWLDQIRRPNWRPSKNDIICSRHFKISDINNPMNKSIASLKPSAVPSIFANRVLPQNNFSRPVSLNKVKIVPKTIRSNTIVRKQIDPKAPGSIVLVPVNKEHNRTVTPVIAKSPPVIVSKAKPTGMTIVKPQVSSPQSPRGTPGRKKKIIDDKKDDKKDDIKSSENENENAKKACTVKKPVLRICVNKRCKQENNGEIRDKGGNVDEERNKKNEQEMLVDQIEAKTVIFKLDPVTREIVILKKVEERGKRSNEGTPVKRPRTEDQSQKVLKIIRDRTRKSCHNLEEKLKMLQKKQLEEQKEINILQNQLLKLQKHSELQRQKQLTNQSVNKLTPVNIKKEENKEVIKSSNEADTNTVVNKKLDETNSQTIIINSSEDESHFVVEFLEPEFMT